MRKLLLGLVALCATLAWAAPPVTLDRGGEKWAEKALHKLSLEEKVGQMFMPRLQVQFLNINSPQYGEIRDAVKKYHLGGFGVTIPVDGNILLKSEPLEAALMMNQLQRESRVPLLYAADFERGLAMRFNGATGFPSAMAFGAAGDKNYAFQMGQITAAEARAIGVRWNWFPVADVNSNPNNPIINTRSFGEDPQKVSELVSAYIAGARGAGMLTTAKHFPGHGDVDADTHLAVARVSHTVEQLNTTELPPFRAAIAAGVDAIMVAHVTVPAIEKDPNRVATLSPAIINGLLKQQLAFKGLVVTDALDMRGVTSIFTNMTPQQAAARATIEAVKAGSDVLVMPLDLDASFHAVVDAVRSGEIPESRIDESVLKILRAKASVGLQDRRGIDLEETVQTIARPESLQAAQNVAQAAITLVRDNHMALPLRRAGTSAPALPYQREDRGPRTAVPTNGNATGDRVVIVSMVDDVRTEGGRALYREIKLRTPDATIFIVDEATAQALAPTIVAAATSADKVVALADIIPSAGRTVRVNGKAVGSIALPPASAQLLTSIVDAAAAKTIVASTGNPYVITSAPKAQTYICSYSDTAVSDIALVHALFGEAPITGHLPVTIPGVAERGAGLQTAVAAH